MATKTMTRTAKAAKNKGKEQGEGAGEPGDGPLMDGMVAAVKKMLARAKERGYVTYDELNSVLPQDQVSSEQIEDTMAMLNEMGINVIESEETEEAAAPEAAAAAAEPEPEPAAEAEFEAEGEVRGGNIDDDELGRTDDPVRMYLREMGSVELLSREGEIAIAKRIEAGREKMIGAICESPLTIKAIVLWHDALTEGKLLLRDIIDLDATYGAGPDGRELAAVEAGADGAGEAAPPPPETEESEADADAEDNSMSLAAMEQHLMPQVLETFERIAVTWKRMSKLQDLRIATMQAGEAFATASERRYTRLRGELVEFMQGVRLNNGRIEQLVDQLYGLNRRLMQFDGELLRQAESAGVKREAFIQHYQGHELDPNWMERIRELSGVGWKRFCAKKYADRIGQLREGLRRLSDECGLPVSEFRRITQLGAAGRARGEPGQEGDGRGQPAPRHLDRQEIHQPRAAVPRPHPGRQHRAHEGGRQVRVPPRLQVLDLRHLVDPAGDHALDRRPGAHHPHPRAHDRDHQQAGAHLAPDAARDRARAHARGARGQARHAAREGAQGLEDRQGADQPRDADRRRGGQPSGRLHRGQERGAAARRRDPGQPARDHDARAGDA